MQFLLLKFKTLKYLPTFLPSYLTILLPCYLDTLLPWYLATFLPSYLPLYYLLPELNQLNYSLVFSTPWVEPAKLLPRIFYSLSWTN